MAQAKLPKSHYATRQTHCYFLHGQSINIEMCCELEDRAQCPCFITFFVVFFAFLFKAGVNIYTTGGYCQSPCDFVGPLEGKTFFIMVDTHSKWPEVIPMSTTTSHHTIEALRSVFSRFGLPDQLISDNSQQFISDEFTQFLKRNGIKHILSAPYHPSSNGLAEHFVQTFKQAMQAGEKDASPSELFLQRQV